MLKGIWGNTDRKNVFHYQGRLLLLPLCFLFFLVLQIEAGVRVSGSENTQISV
jgi:hypothetical protein